MIICPFSRVVLGNHGICRLFQAISSSRTAIRIVEVICLAEFSVSMLPFNYGLQNN